LNRQGAKIAKEEKRKKNSLLISLLLFLGDLAALAVQFFSPGFSSLRPSTPPSIGRR
jgi:hypothetical protein